MKTKIFIVTASLLAMAGCVAPATRTVGGSATACAAYTITVTDCDGDKNDPIVDIDTVALTFDPPIICSKKQRTIKFELNPPPEDKDGTAAIFPKDFTDAWLTGTNVPNKNRIMIKVPHWVAKKTYQYMFVTSTGNCVDPRVEVVD